MTQGIVIGVFAVLIVGGAFAVWYIENGPEKKDDDEEEKEK